MSFQLIQQYDGRFALSDDSHGPQAVGLNYSRMKEYILRVGIQQLWTLEPSPEPNIGGRYTRPRRVDGDVWERDFWKKANKVSK